MSHKLHSVFSENVRSLVADRGWSQSDLARAMNVTPSFISQLLSGHRHPGLDSLEAIGKALKVDPSELLKALSRAAAKSA